MLILRQSRYDFLLLGLVVVLSIGANLPDDFAIVDKRVLLAALALILAICLVRYVRISLVLVTAVLIVGANLPEGMAEEFGIDRSILLLTLVAMVGAAIFNHYSKKIPTGEEPEAVARSVHGAKALFNAVLKGNVNVVQALVKSGVNVNVRTLTGKTPLMAASYKGYADVVQMLLNAGAEPNARDSEGTAALDVARHRGYSRIVAYLKMAGAEDKPEFLDVASITNETPAVIPSRQLH